MSALWWGLRKDLVGRIRPLSVYLILLATAFASGAIYYLFREGKPRHVIQDVVRIGWKRWLLILGLSGVSVYVGHMIHKHLRNSRLDLFIVSRLLLAAMFLYLAGTFARKAQTLRTWFGFTFVVVAVCLFLSQEVLNNR